MRLDIILRIAEVDKRKRFLVVAGNDRILRHRYRWALVVYTGRRVWLSGCMDWLVGVGDCRPGLVCRYRITKRNHIDRERATGR